MPPDLPSREGGTPEGGKRTRGVDLIAAERQRQVDAEGWTAEHDDSHTSGELAMAAAAYAIPNGRARRAELWPWDEPMKWSNRTREDRIRELVKAGALIAAEIDRLRRFDAP